MGVGVPQLSHFWMTGTGHLADAEPDGTVKYGRELERSRMTLTRPRQKMASILFNTSGVSRDKASSAPRFSWICSTRLAPVITVDTCGLAAHQAIDSCASDTHSSSSVVRSVRWYCGCSITGRCS